MRHPTQMASAHDKMITRTVTRKETSNRTHSDVFLSNSKDSTSHISERQSRDRGDLKCRMKTDCAAKRSLLNKPSC